MFEYARLTAAAVIRVSPNDCVNGRLPRETVFQRRRIDINP